jgi:hypothetical protein
MLIDGERTQPLNVFDIPESGVTIQNLQSSPKTKSVMHVLLRDLDTAHQMFAVQPIHQFYLGNALHVLSRILKALVPNLFRRQRYTLNEHFLIEHEIVKRCAL